MHVRLPKPTHGWRAFVGEVGVIVLGVLIAIALGQLVDTVHWNNQVQEARVALGEEMAHTNKAFAFRVAAHDCIARRLTKLNDIVEQAARHDASSKVGEVIPDIGNALSSNIWETNRAAQTLTHFDRFQLRLYGSYYTQLGNVQAFMGQEVQDWGIVEVLEGDPNRLGPSDISGVRVAIKHATFENHIIASIAQEELVTSRQLHVAVPTADPARLSGICRPL
jgi:type II secretory pathway pseudopilin PulG